MLKVLFPWNRTNYGSFQRRSLWGEVAWVGNGISEIVTCCGDCAQHVTYPLPQCKKARMEVDEVLRNRGYYLL